MRTLSRMADRYTSHEDIVAVELEDGDAIAVDGDGRGPLVPVV